MSNRKRSRWSARRSIRRSSSVTRWRWCSMSSRPIADVARSIGVNEGTLGNWVAKARRERGQRVRASSGDERAELAELRAENAQLRMERDLLKRSMAFWVKESAP